MFIRDVFTRFDDFPHVLCCSRSESSRFLLQVLESVSEADLDEVLERILDAVEKQPRMSVLPQCCDDDCYCYDYDCCDEFCLCCQCPPA